MPVDIICLYRLFEMFGVAGITNESAADAAPMEGKAPRLWRGLERTAGTDDEESGVRLMPPKKK